MKAELKEKWVAALRSGAYEQGECALRTEDDMYCCLGVLCDVVNPQGWEKPLALGRYVFSDSSQYLKDGMLEAVGLTPQEQANLIVLNDTEAKTFAEIADYIEKEL